ncbi:hypothetical protein OH492_13525 [Vibrio chagasii]|nr:hypothetical protein [Vibrio chagasii]
MRRKCRWIFCNTAPSHRCFPGQGDFPVIDFVKTLKDKGAMITSLMKCLTMSSVLLLQEKAVDMRSLK